MEELFVAYEFLEAVKDETNHMTSTAFFGMYAMLIEEWCRANGADVVEMITAVRELVVQVNEEDGRY